MDERMRFVILLQDGESRSKHGLSPSNSEQGPRQLDPTGNSFIPILQEQPLWRLQETGKVEP